jgi:hypothetical protein
MTQIERICTDFFFICVYRVRERGGEGAKEGGIQLYDFFNHGGTENTKNHSDSLEPLNAAGT